MPKQVTNDRIVQNTNNEQIFTSLSLTDFTRDPSLSSGWQLPVLLGLGLGGFAPPSPNVLFERTCHSEWNEVEWGISSPCHHHIVPHFIGV